MVTDFRRRFLSLLSYRFSSFHPSLALSILQNKKSKEEVTGMFWGFCSYSIFPHLFWLISDYLQLSASQSWNPLSPPMISNVWSCTPGAWWTTTSSWTWSQLWLACFSSNSWVMSPCLRLSVYVSLKLRIPEEFSSRIYGIVFPVGITAWNWTAAQDCGATRKGNWTPELAAYGPLQPHHQKVCACQLPWVFVFIFKDVYI